MPNFSNAPKQRDFGEPIPDGEFVRLKMNIRPGGWTMPNEDPRDNGLFKKSDTSDVVFMDCEFTVVCGQYVGRQLWENIVVYGGKVNDKGQSIAANISQGRLCAMLESGFNVMPSDKSPQAEVYRVPPAYALFQNLEFAARIGVQEGDMKDDGSHYFDKNIISHVVTPDEPEYMPTMQGTPVAPKPSGKRPGRGRPQGGQQSLFGGNAGGAAAPAAAHWSTQQPPAAATGAPAAVAAQPQGAGGGPAVAAQPGAPAAAAASPWPQAGGGPANGQAGPAQIAPGPGGGPAVAGAGGGQQQQPGAPADGPGWMRQ